MDFIEKGGGGAILLTPETLSRSVVTTKPLKLFNTNYST